MRNAQRTAIADVTIYVAGGVQAKGAYMEDTASILTITEIAELPRCSKAHVQKALVGKFAGVPQLAHLSMGRRKLVRKEWLGQWMEPGKTR